MPLPWLLLTAALVLALLAVVRLAVMKTDAATARTKIAEGATVLDVRTPGEFAAGHYPGARNIPVNELEGRTAEAGDPGRPVVVYCASGMRSAQAAKILAAAGFTDVTNGGGLGNL